MGFHLIGVSFGAFLAHHIAVATATLGAPAAWLPWWVLPLGFGAVGLLNTLSEAPL